MLRCPVVPGKQRSKLGFDILCCRQKNPFA
jgi:hypothetical protein